MSEKPREQPGTGPKLGPSLAQITIMNHNIHAIIGGNAKRRRRRVRAAVAGVGAAAVLGIAITAGTIGVQTAPEEMLDNTFDCYLTPALTPEVSRVAYFDDDVAAYGSRAEFALVLCDVVYGHTDFTPQNPTVCELPDLRLAVFPNPDDVPAVQFCTALGLGPADD